MEWNRAKKYEMFWWWSIEKETKLSKVGQISKNKNWDQYSIKIRKYEKKHYIDKQALASALFELKQMLLDLLCKYSYNIQW